MYEFQETSEAHDRFWMSLANRLRARGVPGVPAVLSRPVDPNETWLDERLLIGQTCGYPLVTSLAGRVAWLGTPCYRAPGCHGPRYRSWLIARADGDGIDSFRNRRAAINAWDSLSGCKALEMILPGNDSLGDFFSEVIVTGSHAASIRAVAESRADVAAIDCVTWELLARNRPSHLHGARIIGAGPLLPALPFITSISTAASEIEILRSALEETIRDPVEPARPLLFADVRFDEENAYRREISERLAARGAG